MMLRIIRGKSCFGLVVQDGCVVEAGSHARWTVGKTAEQVRKWYESKGFLVEETDEEIPLFWHSAEGLEIRRDKSAMKVFDKNLCVYCGEYKDGDTLHGLGACREFHTGPHAPTLKASE